MYFRCQFFFPSLFIYLFSSSSPSLLESNSVNQPPRKWWWEERKISLDYLDDKHKKRIKIRKRMEKKSNSRRRLRHYLVRLVFIASLFISTTFDIADAAGCFCFCLWWNAIIGGAKMKKRMKIYIFIYIWEERELYRRSQQSHYFNKSSVLFSLFGRNHTRRRDEIELGKAEEMGIKDFFLRIQESLMRYEWGFFFSLETSLFFR